MIETGLAAFIVVVGLYSSYASKATERFQLPTLLATAAFVALLPKSPSLAVTSLLFYAIAFAFIKRTYNRPRVKSVALPQKNRALRAGMFALGICIASGAVLIGEETLSLAGKFSINQETLI